MIQKTPMMMTKRRNKFFTFKAVSNQFATALIFLKEDEKVNS